MKRKTKAAPSAPAMPMKQMTPRERRDMQREEFNRRMDAEKRGRKSC